MILKVSKKYIERTKELQREDMYIPYCKMSDSQKAFINHARIAGCVEVLRVSDGKWVSQSNQYLPKRGYCVRISPKATIEQLEEETETADDALTQLKRKAAEISQIIKQMEKRINECPRTTK